MRLGLVRKSSLFPRAGVMALGAVLLLLAGEDAFAQKKKKKNDKDIPPAAETLPADALKFGLQAEESASEDLKKWADGFAKDVLRSQPVDPQATMKRVDERWPQESELTRDAITFLAFYLAYKDEDENYRTLGYRIRDIDRETKEIGRQLQMIWKNQESRGASPLQSQSQQARVAEEERIQAMESTLRGYGDERQMKATQMETARKKINLYLRLLDVAHKRMSNSNVALLAKVK